MDLSSTIANPQLRDSLILRVLPDLTVAQLGRLRGSCRSLRDLLDDELSGPAWVTALEHFAPLLAASSHIDDQHQEHAMHGHCRHPREDCTTAVRLQSCLRHAARLVSCFRVAGQVTTWSDAMYELDLTSARWSPCGRWAAIVQAAVVQHAYGLWRIAVYDTLTNAKRILLADQSQPVVQLQWLQQTGWLLYVTQSTLSTERVLVCAHMQTQQQYKSVVQGFRSFLSTESIRTCVARDHSVAAWVMADATVALLRLPSLDLMATLQCSPPFCVHAITFSPDSTCIALRCNGPNRFLQSYTSLLQCFDVSTGSSIGSPVIPWYGVAVWAPTLDRIFGPRADMRTSQRNPGFFLHVTSGQLLRLPVFVEADGDSCSAWLPDGQSIIICGHTKAEPGSCMQRTLYLVLLDGTIALSWQLSHHMRNPLSLPFHPLDPLWSEGFPGLVQPYDPGLVQMLHHHLDSAHHLLNNLGHVHY